MAITDLTTVQSPGWWMSRLTRRLITDQRPKVQRLNRLYRGDHDRPCLFDRQNEMERDLLREFEKTARSNYLALVVEAVIERMKVDSIRTASKADNVEAMKIWKGAHLDADQIILYRASVATSLGYVIVGEHPRKPGKPLVTIEDPANVITEAFQDDRREQQAGLKLWADAFGLPRATLYMPNWIFRYRRDSVPDDQTSLSQIYTEDDFRRSWSLQGTPERNRLGRVPVVPFGNRVSVDGTCTGEFEDVVDIQNRINTTLLHRLVAEKFGAFRQTAILNLAFEEEDEVDENGNKTGDTVPVVPELPNSPGVAWLLQGEHLQMWQSAQTSTTDILAGVEADIRDLAAITRTPPHYLLNGIVNASGDALSAAETGLISKVRERIAQAAQSWEIVLRLAFLVIGRADLADEDSTLEVEWADPQFRSLAEVSDAAVKQVTAGVPWRSRMRLLGKSEEEIDRMETERTQDAMLAMLAAPAPAAAPSPQGTPQEASQGASEAVPAGAGTQ